MPSSTYAGIAAALAVGAFVISFSTIPIDQKVVSAPLIPITTLEGLGNAAPLDEQLEALRTDLIPLPHQEEEPIDGGFVLPPPPTVEPEPETEPISTPSKTEVEEPEVESVPVDPMVAKLGAATVNIVCSGNGADISGSSGSGVIIDSRGVILTVAHLAQYYLLADYPSDDSIKCVIRTGSPARRAYIASPIYISESWIRKNPRTLVTQTPKGTGEFDYALLAITGSANGAALPSSFPYIPLTTTDPVKGAEVLAGGYPGQTLTATQIQQSLTRIVATTTVKDRFTFTQTSVDVITLSGTVLAQTGTSGGGVMGSDGTLWGLVATSKTSGPFMERTMSAITPGHIRRSFQAGTNGSLDQFLARSLPKLVESFRGTAEELTDILVTAITD